jgi:exosome complex RNA-binding protein Csl4
MSEQKTSYLEAARRVAGLIDSAGYALCARCKSRLENDGKVYCPSCEEIIFCEKRAGVFKP